MRLRWRNILAAILVLIALAILYRFHSQAAETLHRLLPGLHSGPFDDRHVGEIAISITLISLALAYRIVRDGRSGPRPPRRQGGA